MQFEEDPDWDEEGEDEDMDAEYRMNDEWIRIQERTFTRWTNEHLKTVNKTVSKLETDLADGLRLVALIEVLSGKKFKKINKRPNFINQKLENVTMALMFLENDEGIRIVNIDSGDIVDGNLKLILGLIWTLILHYSISMPMWEGEEPTPSDKAPTPKQRLLNWVQTKVPDQPIHNFTTDWNDGKAIGALVDAVGPGLCPDWEDWNPESKENRLKNCKEAMDAAEKWLDVPKLITPIDMANPKVDELSVMTYLSQFPNAKLKPGAPVRPKSNPARVRAYGPGLEPTGNQVGAPARFTVETFSAGKGELDIIVLNPKGQKEPCEVTFNSDRNMTYSCVYTPKMEGEYRVIIKFSSKEIPKSPYCVKVEGAMGDSTKVTAIGPGLEKTGVIATKKTYFEVFTKDAGKGTVDVAILDPHGHRDKVRASITPVVGKEGTFLVEYVPIEPGLHSVNVFFTGKQIPGSPYGVNVAPVSNAKACYASGRGIQPRGIRVKDNAVFYVHTKGAGNGEVRVQIFGPGGSEEKCSVKPVQGDEGVYECVYVPSKPGNYIINVTFGDQHINKSPFKVEVGPVWNTKIRAYGPGLEGGVVNQPAVFTVETNGEVGALGFSIEGPSQAKIDCKDNGDGSADVTYFPTEAGEYAVHILCNDEDIPKSPYMANIVPAQNFNAAKVIAKGPGLERTGIQANKWAEFTVDTRGAGHAPLIITCMDVDYNPVDVQVTDNGNGTYSCRYMPKKNVKHTICITFGGVMIPNAPFRVYVSEPSNPSKVKVYGPGVEKGVKTNKPTFFVVDCKDAGPGDVAVGLTDERGVDVPVTTTDNQDGTFKVEYEPQTPGLYTVLVYFANKEVPQSPIKVKIEPSIDVSKVKVVGLEPTMPIGQPKEISVISKGLPKAETKVKVVSPTNQVLDVPTTPTGDGATAKFALLEPGPHQVQISYGGIPVPESPFSVEAVPAAPKVKAYGPGLKGGEAMKPAVFTIDTREETSPGGLGLFVEGPAESKIECVDNQDGTCNVSYLPPVPGDYVIKIAYADKPIPGSPFKAKVTPNLTPVIEQPTMAATNAAPAYAAPPMSGPDVSGIRCYGPGLNPAGVFMDCPNEFTVDAKSVSPVADGKVNAVVTSPSGQRLATDVKNNGDGTYNVTFTPMEQGPQQIDVTYEDLPVPESPLNVTAVPGNDPNRVKAYGPGLEGGFTAEPAVFTVDMKGAGRGGLGLGIEGPVETPMECVDNHDGTCNVTYQPKKAGPYDVSVNFADRPIPGSPFHVDIKNPVDASKVKCYGPGLDSNQVKAGVPATFTVDAKEAGEAPIEATVKDSTGAQRPVDLVPVEEGMYQATYVPAKEGPCTVEVKHGDQQVPDSPFQVNVQPGVDPSKVKVTGPGVMGTTPASMPAPFKVDAREAGDANLDVFVKRPDETYIRPFVQDNNDKTYDVVYTPEDLGVYDIAVQYAGQDVPGSPFNVKATPTGDASKCKIMAGDDRTVPVGKETVITVDAADAGVGKVTCRIRSPSGSDIDIDIIDNDDGTFSINFTPQFPGNYTIEIKFGGELIPEGTYDIKAVPEDEYQEYLDSKEQEPVGEDMIMPEQMIREHAAPPQQSAPGAGGLFQPVDFTLPVGPIFNFVSATVVMPSGKRAYPNIEDNKDGTVTVRYQPTETGTHELHMEYNNEEIEGSPFLFHVESVDSGYVTAYGPGLSHGVVHENAVFTINTKNAGAGGLSLAIEGPSKTAIQCKDNEDGTCTVSYVPTAPGEYLITVKFADKHIAGSPFTSKITPGEPKRKNQIMVGSSSEVSLKVTEQDIESLTATIISPSGKEEPCFLKRLQNGHLGITFTPHETGEHLVNVFRNGQHIENSPFKIQVGESEIGNANKVKIYGKGLEEGMANTLNEFIVDTREAGYGGMSLSIEGPSKADIVCHDNEDGTCRVTYRPTEPGTYIINIKFADQHVPGSPFTVNIGGEPSAKITERITRHKEAADVTNVGSQCELSLKIPGTTPLDMTASVKSPSGVTELCDVNPLDDSHYSIKFVPQEMGIHTVSVKHKDMHIPGSPFEFTVGPIAGGGAHKVHAAGPGLERGEVNQPADFNIYTREAGAGGLSIAVEGPSKAEIDFQDKKDGSCNVSYRVTEPGEYYVSVKFNDEHIPDSPFRVNVTPSIGDARMLSVQTQDKNLEVGKPAAFVVNFNGAKGRLTARVVSPSGAEEEALVQEIDEGQYAVRFIPRENGVHLVHVLFDNHNIPESPFKICVGKVDADAGKVTAYGDGLQTGKTGQVARFIVNTVNAGSGSLAVTVEGPSKVKLECREVDEGYEFSYSPTAPGDYMICIRYAGVNVAGSPFKAKIEGQGQPSAMQEHASVVVETVTKTSTTTQFRGIQRFSSDASKVTANGAGLSEATRGKTATFTLDASKAGNNIMYVGMMGPGGPCDELHVMHQGNLKYSVNYIVKEVGRYMLIVRWGDQDIPGSPFAVEVK